MGRGMEWEFYRNATIPVTISGSIPGNYGKCVLLCFVDPILGNLTVRGHWGTWAWGFLILSLHLNYFHIEHPWHGLGFV